MPACFQLFPIGSNIPARFIDIDNAMCAYFGVTPDADLYYRYWYDTEGFSLACGRSFNDLRAIYPDRQAIIDWLEANYTVHAWYER